MPLDTDTKPSVTLIKRFTYRGADEEWGNSYHFDIDDPADDANWVSLCNALRDAEVVCYGPEITVVRAYGYNGGNTLADFVRDYIAEGETAVGTLDGAVIEQANPGDAAGWLRWVTPDRTSSGKKIYLRKYFHGVQSEIGAPDSVWADQRTAFVGFGQKMTDTTFHAGTVICGPTGAAASSPVAGAFVTTRTLKRRGKRPPS